MFLPRLPETCFNSMTRVDFAIPILQPPCGQEMRLTQYQNKNKTGGQRGKMSTVREIPGGDRCPDPE